MVKVDREKIRTLYAQKPAHHSPHNQCPSVVLIALMNNETGLGRAIALYDQLPVAADLFLWKWDKNKLEFAQDHLIKSHQKLFLYGPLIIDAPVSENHTITGRALADSVIFWLTQNGYPKNHSLPIILLGMSTKVKRHSELLTFGETLYFGLLKNGYKPKIYISNESVWTCPDGKDLCGKEQYNPEKKVSTLERWQGGDVWLNPGRQEMYGVENITPENRCTDFQEVLEPTIRPKTEKTPTSAGEIIFIGTQPFKNIYTPPFTLNEPSNPRNISGSHPLFSLSLYEIPQFRRLFVIDLSDLLRHRTPDKNQPIESAEKRPAQTVICQPSDIDYDHIAIIAIMDDLQRLTLANMHLYSYYKADLYLWKKNTTEDYSLTKHLILTGKALTKRSKLIIYGHGPLMAGLGGYSFAKKLDQWFTLEGCPKNQTPSITLSGCACAKSVDNDRFFAEQLHGELSSLGRSTTITASTATVWLANDGNDLCASLEAGSTRRIKT